jgi:hypothetical protein
MRAAYASAINYDDPLSGLVVGDVPEPALPDDDWVTVEYGPARSTTTTCGPCAG